jgi:hypothetical protein
VAAGDDTPSVDDRQRGVKVVELGQVVGRVHDGRN